ncbi:MAG: hypothetical protein EOP61_18855 [Sphingomonadales bacterium]|nr:MAG: hypothetical protein EOP61_18855 [Sphingomonadales bacterium]
MAIRAKRHRLSDGAYRGQKNVAFTMNVERRRPLFGDAAVVGAMLAILREETERYGCLVGIYCFMPDHLHLILCGQTEGADAKRAVDAFKHRTGLWLRRKRPGFSWQDDYYDHIIRKGDDWRRQVFYVYMNPVRRELVEDPAAWPHTGSMGFDLDELLIDAHY